MKHIIYFLVSVLVILSAGACKKTDVDDKGYGYLYVSLDKDLSEDIVFKSTPEELGMTFALDVINSAGTVCGHVDDYTSLAESPMTLPAVSFDYTAVAYSGTDGAAAFDAPFYSGSAKFKIAKDEMSNINIACSLANVKVTADFSEDIKKNFSRYQLTVTNGAGTLVFDSAGEAPTVDKTGYFSATGTLSWTLELVNKDGEKYTASDTYSDVKARQYYNLSFSLEKEDEFGGGAFTIILNDSMDEKEYDLVLDFGDETKPEMTADFDYSEPVYITAGDASKKTLSLTSEDGFKSIVLEYPDPRTKETVSCELVGASTEVLGTLAGNGVIVASVPEGSKSVSVDISSYAGSLAIGESFFDVFMVDVNNVFDEERITFNVQSPVDVEAVSANAWARFATVEAKWFPASQPEGISFQYRKDSDSQWIDFDGSVSINSASRTYSAEIRGLEPKTMYRFRAVTAEDKETKELNFTTEAEGVIHNMSFDSWYKPDGSNAWYPNLDLSEANYVWDSANKGTSDLFIGSVTPTTPESDLVAVAGEGKKAVKLVSSTALGQFAAGNLYTGKFDKVSGLGAELDWGVPFVSRPLALTGYYMYIPKIIDKGTYNNMTGKTDIGQIQILLTDWNYPFHINTSKGTFVDFQGDPAIIAYGSFETSETMEKYEQFTIKLDYRDVTRTPKYIVIVAAASKYGDYFTGGVGSTLYLDEFEFIYDPDELDKK